jgi:hypothetical protein
MLGDKIYVHQSTEWMKQILGYEEQVLLNAECTQLTIPIQCGTLTVTTNLYVSDWLHMQLLTATPVQLPF